MAGDLPDGTKRIVVSVTVGTDQIPETAVTETAVIVVDRLSTTSTSYQDVVSWTVSTDKVGILHRLEMECDNYAKTRFRVAIAGAEKFTDQEFEGPYNMEFPDVKLAAGTVVLLQAKSTDGTEINVDGDIIGKEVG